MAFVKLVLKVKVFSLKWCQTTPLEQLSNEQKCSEKKYQWISRASILVENELINLRILIDGKYNSGELSAICQIC